MGAITVTGTVHSCRQYNYYVSVGEDNAKEKSAIDVGVLLKQVLSDDVYWEYELIKGYTNEYRRIGRK